MHEILSGQDGFAYRYFPQCACGHSRYARLPTKRIKSLKVVCSRVIGAVDGPPLYGNQVLISHLRYTAILCSLAAASMTSPQTGFGDDAVPLSFLGEGHASLSFRYRYETVDQQGLGENAHASTLRTRLTFDTPNDNSIRLRLEADNVLRLGGLNFSDGNRVVAGHPVVADPEGTEINQAYLELAAHDKAVMRVGRQRINRDDQRFVGGVGWRQNEQTYDAAHMSLALPGSARLDYDFLWNINRVFGPDGGDQLANWACKCHLFNISATPWPGAKVSVFLYALDIEDAANLANRTLGIRLAGSRSLENDLKAEYLVSFATQTDAGDNAVDYRENYFHGRLGIAGARLKGSVGLEVLSGETAVSGSSFVTPLATLHAFNGWADKFLATPDAGLRDFYLRLDAPIAQVTTTLVYHRFSADAGSADYGEEWDFSVNRKVSKRLAMLGKLAAYRSDGFASDTDKFWLMVSFSP